MKGDRDMRTRKWVGVAFMLAGAIVLSGVRIGRAEVASDRAAAIVVFPRIAVDEVTETQIQLTNTSTDTQIRHCFYINATSHCSISQRACDNIEDPCENAEGLCLPGWIETDFQVILTPRQPIAWVASKG